jgi:hypothetical protein
VKEDGSVFSDQAGIKGMVQQFYEDLFSSEPMETMDTVPAKFDDHMNASLCKPYSNEEIRTVLFQMGPTKVPGPDSFLAMFYQVHWDLVQTDVCDALRSFLGGDDIPEGFYDSVIMLNPKVTNPEHLSEFRPIGMCNVSKVFANMLNVLLPNIVSEYQSAFVLGRLTI